MPVDCWTSSPGGRSSIRLICGAQLGQSSMRATWSQALFNGTPTVNSRSINVTIFRFPSDRLLDGQDLTGRSYCCALAVQLRGALGRVPDFHFAALDVAAAGGKAFAVGAKGDATNG